MGDLEAIKSRHPANQINALGANDMKDIRDLIAECERLTTENRALEDDRNYWRDTEEKTMRTAQGLQESVETLTAEGALLREALQHICDYHAEGGVHVITCKRIAGHALRSVSGSHLSGPAFNPQSDPRFDADDSRPKNCGQCPHDVGDSHERDCDWPNCVDQRHDK